MGGASSPEDAFQRHSGHEWGHVLSGTLQVAVGFRQYLLEAGDSLSLDSTTPHRLANVGDTPVHAIWFVLGRDAHDAAVRDVGLRAGEVTMFSALRHPGTGPLPDEGLLPGSRQPLAGSTRSL